MLILRWLLIVALGITPSYATFLKGQAYKPVVAVTFTGLLDQFPSNSPTFGFSAYKFQNAFAGNWGTVQRQSDNATQVISFLSTGKADTATFSSFCSGTNCYAKILTDQINSNNPTQATLANMPRVIVNANGNMSVCAQPGSVMPMAFSSTVNTAKQHLFAVVRQGYADRRFHQSDLPTFAFTGTVANGGNTITAMSTQVGMSAANGGSSFVTNPGVTDASNFIPNAPVTAAVGMAGISSFTSGTAASLNFYPGNIGLLGSASNEAMIYTNAIAGGAWISNGPVGANFQGQAYWGYGVGTNGGNGSDVSVPLNGATGAGDASNPSMFGQGLRSKWAVVDYDTFTGGTAYDGVVLRSRSSPGNITYSTNVGMTLFGNQSGSENPSNTCFETMILFPATQTQRVSMASFLKTQSALPSLSAPVTSDGFTMAGVYQPNNFQGNSTIYGGPQFGPDVFSQIWFSETGGYEWPAAAYATNINNGATMWRFIVKQGDNDTAINGNERTEIGAYNTGKLAIGDDISLFNQMQFEAIPTQAAGWCYVQQVHTGSATSAPDLLTASCENDQIQFQYQNGTDSAPNTFNCGAAQTLTVGTTYAWQAELHWSTNHTSDTLAIWFGTNGGTLTQICSVSGALFVNDPLGAYIKQGLYRGDPWVNPGSITFRSMNYQMAKTANAFSAYRTTQPALPTH
jgi:hypothetical protein